MWWCPVIEVKNITKTYQMGENSFQALKGVSFSIAQGELMAIVGPSGSGKSTTMNILGLLDKPTTGTYFLDGINTLEFSGNKQAALRNERLGFIFQSFFLLPKLSALENVMLPLSYRRSDTHHAIKERAMAILAEVGMDRFAHHKPSELSGGQQQRVAIARALVGKPSIILADEPTGALDTKTSDQIIALLEQQMENTKTTVVIITHDLEIADRCHRAIHVRDGLIEEAPSHGAEK